MTSTGIKFYKFNNSTESATKITSAKAVEGAVIYLVDVRELWIGGQTPKLVIKGANDVTFSNNVLTITHYDNAGTATTQTLNFSDVASASQTMAVFNQIYTKMGLTGDNHDTLDYTGTNYLTSATNLVNADKALDTAIHTNTHKGAATGAVYDTDHLSSTWTTVVTDNTIAAGDTLDSDIDKLDKKVARLADEVIANEQVTQEAFTAVANSVGLEQDMSLDLSADSLKIIKDDKSVKEALIDLDDYVATKAGKVDDVKINDTTIVSNKIANIVVDGTYNATDNKIATKSTVTEAINALDVAEDKGAASISGSTITINAVQQENGKIKDGGSTTISLDGTYNAETNKIATKSTVTTAIDAIGGAGLAVDNAGVITATTQTTSDDTTNVATTEFVHNVVETLDTQNDVQAVDYTAATSSTGAKLTFKGVSETDGKIAQGTGDTELQFAKVATTGAAADVSYTNTTSGMTATDVQAAIDELDGRVDSLVGGMRYNGDINTTTAPVNTSTGDIRSGDIYLAAGPITIGTTSVEAGDMIVYKGATSSDPVTLTASNCTIIERETDTMVTAGDTLTDDYLVFGSGNKEVSVTSTVDGANYQVSASDLKTAITNANSALQSISKGKDGTYVTTTIGTKTNNNQTVGVEVTQSTVTYTATSGSTGPDLSVASGNEGLLNSNAITPIKNYVDDKVSNVVSDLDVDEYAQATVDTTTTTGQTSITIKGIKEADGLIGASASAQDTTIVVDGTYDDSTNKLATQSTVTNAINGLGADITSDDDAVATVEVVETNGKITDVVVTNVSAGVTYTPSEQAGGATGASANLAAGSSAAAQAGAVTGADIAAIKSYVDDKSAMCWEEYE